MDRVFKSKVGWWYHLILLVMAASTVAAFVGGKSPVTMIVLLLFTLECIHMLLSTWYKITADGYLIAHCSFFPEKRIPISEISAVEVTCRRGDSDACLELRPVTGPSDHLQRRHAVAIDFAGQQAGLRQAVEEA